MSPATVFYYWGVRETLFFWQIWSWITARQQPFISIWRNKHPLSAVGLCCSLAMQEIYGGSSAREFQGRFLFGVKGIGDPHSILALIKQSEMNQALGWEIEFYTWGHPMKEERNICKENKGTNWPCLISSLAVRVWLLNSSPKSPFFSSNGERWSPLFCLRCHMRERNRDIFIIDIYATYLHS